MPFVSLSDFHWMQNWNFLVVSEELNAVLPAWVFSGREKDTPCLCSHEHFEKPCPGVQSTGPGRAQPDAAALADTFSFLFFLSGSQQPGVPYYTDPGGPVMNPMAMAFHVQPNSPQGNPVYPPPPSYCNTPPPPYEQVVKSSTWGLWLSDLTVWEEGAIAKWPRRRASALLNTC